MTIYTPDLDSLRTHPLPDWFDDAKFGIFIHFGVYCIPAWAETTKPPLEYADQGDEGIAYGFLHNTYTEWYLNTINLEGSLAREHHLSTYGGNYSYDNFAPLFAEAMRDWDPEPWADLFAASGARYVVMVTKHHDGFLMWPSRTPNPFKQGWHLQRDIVGELAEVVRARGLKFGLYYSGGLDWTFGGLPMKDMRGLIAAIPQSEEYARYADAHWRELIERYRPSVLWNDIYYPPLANPRQLFADYYNLIPDGVINDRFDTLSVRAGSAHADFVTPEYQYSTEGLEKKWELCRGMGPSFGYNRNETDEHRLSSEQLIQLLIDVTSKRGNLLLNVGPTAEGVIPQPQADRLIAIGRWLREDSNPPRNPRTVD